MFNSFSNENNVYDYGIFSDNTWPFYNNHQLRQVMKGITQPDFTTGCGDDRCPLIEPRASEIVHPNVLCKLAMLMDSTLCLSPES